MTIIGGGLTIAGTLVGVITTYRLSVIVEKRRNRRNACAELNEAFAGTLAFIFIAEKHGNHDRPSIDKHIKTELFSHGKAIERFRPFIPSCNSAAYQNAWEEYREVAAMGEYRLSAESQINGVSEYDFLKNKIQDILSIAEK